MPWLSPILLNVFGMILLGRTLELYPVIHRMKQFEKLVARELRGEVMHEGCGSLSLLQSCLGKEKTGEYLV